MMIDATNAIVGRLAAVTAKAALEGQDVVLVNIEKAVISGDPEHVVAKYKGRRGMQNKANPDHSPKWPRRADYLFKRIVGGMVPKHSARGKAALSKIRAYVSVPEAAKGKAQTFTHTADKLNCRFISLEELCTKL